jgi:hypothetical protein
MVILLGCPVSVHEASRERKQSSEELVLLSQEQERAERHCEGGNGDNPDGK